MQTMNMGLFDTQSNETPWADKHRPIKKEDFIGLSQLVQNYPFLKTPPHAVIFWGPPGTGKTTLAKLYAKVHQLEFFSLNATTDSLGEIKKVIETIDNLRFQGKRSILFIDEIHRLNRSRQDFFLPYLEKNDFHFIGATTENPRAILQKAILSRVYLVQLKKHTREDLLKILTLVMEKEQLSLHPSSINFILDFSDGDARMAIKAIDSFAKNYERNTQRTCEESEKEFLSIVLQEQSRKYDLTEDRHYDVISAFIKSMRGSDPQAAILWLAVMIDGGEDPLFIARRLVIFASEDIGNADPRALTLAVSCLQAVAHIGYPEARIPLAQTTTYLASTIKSNASYTAIDKALEYVKERPNIEVPSYLKSRPPKSEKEQYLYSHNYPEGYTGQVYHLEDGLLNFYEPKNCGQEKYLKERLSFLKNLN